MFTDGRRVVGDADSVAARPVFRIVEVDLCGEAAREASEDGESDPVVEPAPQVRPGHQREGEAGADHDPQPDLKKMFN